MLLDFYCCKSHAEKFNSKIESQCGYRADRIFVANAIGFTSVYFEII